MTEWQPIRSVIKLPPPVPVTTEEVQSYYICNNDEQKGPYTETQLKAMWLNGLIVASTLYWTDGMAEWRPVAELCDAKPQLVAAKKFINDTAQVVRSVYASAERNIYEFTDELDKAKAKGQQPNAETPRSLTPIQKLAQRADTFFTRLDKTVTRITLLRNPPLPKKVLYRCAAYVLITMFFVIGYFLSSSISSTRDTSPASHSFDFSSAREAVTSQVKEECPLCRGTGENTLTPCIQCNGRGTIVTPSGFSTVCPSCGGTGHKKAKCSLCNGTGKVAHKF